MPPLQILQKDRVVLVNDAILTTCKMLVRIPVPRMAGICSLQKGVRRVTGFYPRSPRRWDRYHDKRFRCIHVSGQ